MNARSCEDQPSSLVLGGDSRYNEAATIRGVGDQATRQIEHVIVVDDGSIGGTAEALAVLSVILLRDPTNRGKAASLWRGSDRNPPRSSFDRYEPRFIRIFNRPFCWRNHCFQEDETRTANCSMAFCPTSG